MSLTTQQVLHCRSQPIDLAGSKYAPFRPSTRLLPKGYQLSEGRRRFAVDTIWEKDVEITMRDRTKIYADIFRPAANDIKVPAIIAWSPYGKNGCGLFSLDAIPGRMGVPLSQTSGLESFEGPDPAEWVQHDYAIVNVDARGSYMSEGDIRFLGNLEGEDGYDTIEVVARRDWCNGKVVSHASLATAGQTLQTWLRHG